MVQLGITDNKNAIYGGIKAFGNSDYTRQHDDLPVLVTTWGIKFNETLHMMTEAYYIWEYHALTGGTEVNGPPQPFFTGVGPGVPIKRAATTQFFLTISRYFCRQRIIFRYETNF